MVTDASVFDATRQEVEEAITMWRNHREVRLTIEKQAEALRKQETALKTWVISVLRAQEYEGVVVGGRITALSTKEVPEVLDKESYLDYVRTTGELDLLQFRPAIGAIKERLDNGVEIPGVKLIDVYDLSDRKS